jgi:hypothetical protein
MQLDMFISQFEYFTFSCFESSLEEIEDFLFTKMSVEKYKIIKQQSFEFDLYKVKPQKGGSHLNKAYFFVPNLNDTIVVMVSNYSDGWQTLTNFISSELKLNAYSFRITNNENDESFNSFSYLKKGNKIRTVYTMKDPKWVFYSEGDNQWFELEEFYKRRLIKNRLNKEILYQYCSKLNFEITNDFFWKSKQCILIEKIDFKQ